MNAWLGLLGALAELKGKGRHSSSLPTTGGRMLLTGKIAEAQMAHKDFLVEGRQSAVYAFIVTNDKSAYLYVVCRSLGAECRK